MAAPSLLQRAVQLHGVKRVWSALTPAQRRGLRYVWPAWARADQLEPEGLWLTWLILAGRGWGKSRTGGQTTHGRAMSGKAKRIALVGADFDDVRKVMIEGKSGILSIAPPHERPLWEPSKRLLTWPNGAVGECYSGHDPGGLRGPEFDWFWADEIAKWTYLDETWDNLRMATRLGLSQGMVTTTPRPRRKLRELLDQVATGSVFLTRGATYDNRANLSEAFFREIARFEGTRLGRQELLGELLTDTPGSLWTLDRIDRLRVGQSPDMERIVVAIDPATTHVPKEEGNGETSDPRARRKKKRPDETGIIVAGRGVDGLFYVLADRSCSLSPAGWARRALKAFNDFKADRIVAETNQGGEMVEETLRAIDSDAPISLVHAKRGKVTRAEPVAALYEQKRARHVGCHRELEDQLTTYVEGESDFSPDRMDAMVYAGIELMLEGGIVSGGWC